MSRKQWTALGDELGIPARLTTQLIARVGAGVEAALAHADEQALGMPTPWVRDVHRRVRKRLRDLS